MSLLPPLRQMPTRPFSLEHPAGIHVSRDLPEAEVRDIPDVRRRDMGTGYVWYDLPSFRQGSEEIWVSLCYFKSALLSISVGMESPALPGSLHELSGTRELRRAEMIASWLDSKGWKLGRYPWGEVWAYRDPKTGDGCGGVHFGSPHRSPQKD